uniref:Uncharacterized protein n=1 Tax=Myoviridae sp. ctshb19 TaxID=2825194 RepID=A0A8S5UGB5_9CAUD|nr:MAG TPA: hypothetical protein [Myoviridae sp. ctshb19]
MRRLKSRQRNGPPLNADSSPALPRPKTAGTCPYGTTAIKRR